MSSDHTTTADEADGIGRWASHVEAVMGEKLPPIAQRARELTAGIAELVERVEIRKAIAREAKEDAQLDELTDAIEKAETKLGVLRRAATHALAGGMARRLSDVAELVAPFGVLLRAMRDDLQIDSLSLALPEGAKVYVNEGRVHFEVDLPPDRPTIDELIDRAIAGERGKV